jgi:predicted amidohydrolase YtcJ
MVWVRTFKEGDSGDDITALGSDMVIVNAKGGLVTPALVNCHAHISGMVQQSLCVDLSNTKTIDEAISLLKERSKTSSDEDWLVGIKMKGPILATKKHLDCVPKRLFESRSR